MDQSRSAGSGRRSGAPARVVDPPFRTPGAPGGIQDGVPVLSSKNAPEQRGSPVIVRLVPPWHEA